MLMETVIQTRNAAIVVCITWIRILFTIFPRHDFQISELSDQDEVRPYSMDAIETDYNFFQSALGCSGAVCRGGPPWPPARV